MMELMGNFPQHSWGLDKVPSPSGSEDSGLGWSPDALTTDYAFQLESSKNFNYIETESTFSPQSQIDYKACYTDVENTSSEGNSPEFSSFNQEQKQADVIELLGIFDQKSDASTASKQPGKKTYGKSTKKRNSASENSQSSKLQRCFQPKTGNGKPRQTSVKRKQSQKSATACPYPGVRVETVREKLKKMREGQGRGGQTPTAVSSAVQSLNAIANNYSSQSFSQASTNSIPQYQQSFCPFQQQSQDVYSSALTQTPPFTPASMTPPVQHNSPNYTASSLTSTNLPYDLRDEEVDCLGETYTSSLPASSPSRSSVCSVPQQIPSPEVSPRLAASTVPSPVSHFSDASSPINYGVVNSVSSTPCGYPNEQVFNYPPATYAGKLSPMRGSPAVTSCEMPFNSSGSPHFSNPNQFSFGTGVRGLVQSVRQGDLQQLRALLAFNGNHVDMQDDSGKTLLFHAIESSQAEVVKLLLQYQPNLNLVDAEGNTVLHVAAACPKSDILMQLLKALPPKEKSLLLCETAVKKGYTPLHVAAEAQLINNFIQLLQCGANYLMQDRDGFSPLHIVIRTANVMALRALLQVAKSASSPLISENNLKTMTNQRTKSYDTPLHYAAELHLSGEGQRHQYEIIKLLLTHGADPSAMNREGKSPKHLLPRSSSLLQMFSMHQVQSTVRYGYSAPEPTGCVPANQYNGAVFPHFQ